jgi:hypothetical protein
MHRHAPWVGTHRGTWPRRGVSVASQEPDVKVTVRVNVKVKVRVRVKVTVTEKVCLARGRDLVLKLKLRLGLGLRLGLRFQAKRRDVPGRDLGEDRLQLRLEPSA